MFEPQMFSSVTGLITLSSYKVPNAKWQCEHCKTVNLDDMVDCHHCGAPRRNL
jgi:hypothetical protein